MPLALVGYTHSYNDQQWLAMAGAWVAERESAAGWASARRVVFDLRGPDGVNFLDDRGEYDVVVLFAIFNPPAGSAALQRSLGQRRGQTSLAANHSRDNWSARLSATRRSICSSSAGRIRSAGSGSGRSKVTIKSRSMRACLGCRCIDAGCEAIYATMEVADS